MLSSVSGYLWRTIAVWRRWCQRIKKRVCAAAYIKKICAVRSNKAKKTKADALTCKLRCADHRRIRLC